jgi:uncharacterized protein (TIGR03437 family)
LVGNGLSPSTRTWEASDISNNKLPESLDGVSVRINNKPAAVQYVSPTQINVLAASDVAAGNVQATVTNANGTSDPVAVSVQNMMPAFFQFAQEYVAGVRADGAYLAPSGLISGLTTVSAAPGDTILLFGTGFGATIPAPSAGEVFQGAYPTANPVTIRIDTAVANVTFAGLISPGLYQFNVTVPDLADGDHSLTAEVGGVRTIKIARLRTQRQSTALRNSKQPITNRAEQKLSPKELARLASVLGLGGVARPA